MPVWFEAQARRTPQAIAVSLDGASERLTYAELNARANQLAHWLRQDGVGPNTLVGLYLDRSLELVVALLGVLKAGGAYLPLDIEAPPARLSNLLAQAWPAGQPRLLTQAARLERLGPQAAGALCLDCAAAELSAAPDDNPPNRVGPEDLAYVIYTSGSTGRPKGVMIPHRALTNHMRWMQTRFPLDANDRVLQKTLITFDASVWEFYAPLLAGAELVLARPGGQRSAGYLAGVIRERQISILQMTPTLLRLLADDPRFAACRSLRRLFCGGEALDAGLARRVQAVLPVEMVNLYGPAEACIDTLYAVLPPGAAPDSVPLGHPVDNTQVYLLDELLRPAAPGQPGELCLGGNSLGLGYLGQPELTAERFVAPPPGLPPLAFPPAAPAAPPERIYRTGDRARQRPDGDLEYLGRVDFQVKIRGARVELEEVEQALLACPGVRQAAARAWAEAPGGAQSLIGYVVAGPEAANQAEADFLSGLRRQLAEILPEYMLPSALLRLEALPLTPSGKVDRQSLPAHFPAPLSAGQSAAPASPEEATLAKIWAEVLRQPQVGRNDNFFDLGGHSLAFARILARVWERYEVDLPIFNAFETPTVAHMARLLAQALAERQAGAPVRWTPITPVSRAGEIPLSYAQEAVWYLLQLAPDALAYNYQILARLHGQVDLGRVEQALSEIIRRHEIFRTTFPAVDGQPVQRIHPPAAADEIARVALIDLRAQPPERRAAEVEAWLAQAFEQRFDITQLPLIRWDLLWLADDEYALVHREHHLVHDGWSFGVLMAEFQAIYTALSRGEPHGLPELAVQFADYAAWQRQAMQGPLFEQQLAYWRTRLGGDPPMLELPTDRPRPRLKSYRGASIQISLPDRMYDAARALAQSDGLTPFMTLLAAFDALMQRYTGLEDILIGSGFANRRSPEAEKLIGMIVNTVALRVDLSNGPDGPLTGRQLFGRVRQAVLEAYDHQDLPFDKLVESLQPRRSLGYNPYFQVLFSFHDSPIPPLELPGASGRLEYRQNQAAKFDLNVVVIPQADQMRGAGAAVESRAMIMVWEYDSDLFERAAIQRMIEHYLALLDALLADPDRPLAEIDLLSPAERQQLETWGNPRRPYPRQATLASLFEQQAAQAPQAVAVEQAELDGRPGRRLTYAELDRRANRLARRLQALGVGPDALVGVSLERSIETIVALLGILKAGGAYLPLDASYPPDRLRFMFEDAGVQTVITETARRESLPGAGRQVICLDQEPESSGPESSGPEDSGLQNRAGPENLAYVIYTSGSTGQPKGVAVPQRAVARLVKNNPFVHLGPDETGLQYAPVAFDASTFEIWGPLLNGGRLVVAPPGQLTYRELEQVIRAYGVTTLWLTAGLFHQMVDLRPEIIPLLRQLLAGGDALSPAHVQKARQAAGGCRIINGYGPTENTTFTCTCDLTSLPALEPGAPIGAPIANTCVYIVDEQMRLVPIGVAGELVTGGDGLALGYLNRPELTAEKFVAAAPGGETIRLYRTGDQARWRADGNIEFLGRRDFQVKLRGFRIELGEIEAALLADQRVKQAAVIARQSGQDRQLVGYVALAEGGPASDPQPVLEALRQQLQARLPDYMLPAALLAVEALPLNANGKLDRSRLPEPAQARPGGPAYQPPRDDLERRLCRLWEAALGVQPVGVEDDFYSLGGHSLLALRLLAQVERQLGVAAPLAALLQTPTVAGLAAALRAAAPGLAGPQAAPAPAPARRQPIPRRAGDEPARLSFAQQRLWFLHQLEGPNPVYNIPLVFALHGQLDEAALARALRRLALRQDSLCSRVDRRGDQPYQLSDPALAPALEVEDLRSQPAAGRPAALEQRLLTLGRQPFNLETGPLARASLFRLDEADWTLLLNLHHIITDEWAQEALYRELEALYREETGGPPAGLPDLPIRYADYAAWQWAWLESRDAERQLAYWTRKLSGAPHSLALPTDFARPPVQRYAGAFSQRRVKGPAVETLRALARSEHVSLFTTLLTAFQVLLYRYAGQAEFLVGTPVTNRTRPELENLVGYILNMLPLRSDLGGRPSFRQALRRAGQAVAEMLEHADLPLDRLVEALKPRRDLSRNPLFQTAFVLHPASLHRLRLPGLEVSPQRVDFGIAKFDLTLFVSEESPHALDLKLEYAHDLYRPESAGRILAHYERLLAAIAADPDAAVDDLAFLEAGESDPWPDAWQPPDAPAPAGASRPPAPPGPLEQALAGVWQETLEVETVGPDDNFFDLGGHSLKAIRLVGQINELLDSALRVRDLFEAPTLAGLAARLRAQAEDPARLEKMAELVLKLLQMSDEEAQALLDSE